MKTKARKIISMFLSAFLLTTIAFAQQNTVHTTATTVAACPGGVVVPVHVLDLNNCGSISLIMFYENSNLTYTGYQNLNPALSGLFFLNEFAPGELRVSWFGLTPISIPDANLFELLFTYDGGGVSAMQWDTVIGTNGVECVYSDPSGMVALPAIFHDGEVSSLAITTQPTDITVGENQPATFSVVAPGATNFQWQESTNGITWNNLSNAGIYSGVNTNTLNISAAASTMDGYLYRVYVSGGQCPDTSSSAILNVNAIQPIITTIGTDSSCYVPQEVPVLVDEFYGVAAISLTLDYDETKVSYSGYQNPNPILTSGTLQINATGGEVFIAWNSPALAANLGSGKLLDLVFAPIPGVSGTSFLNWDTIPAGQCEYHDISGNTIPAHFVNGSIRMDTLPTPNISGDTEVCENESGLVYFTPLVIGNTYNWTITGGTIVSSNVNQVTVSWGQAGTGSLSVTETNPATGCDSTSTLLVNINPSPTQFNVTGGGGYCQGTGGIEIGLDGSETNVTYQLRLFSTNIGSPVNGTGAPISFGMLTAAGNYSVRATSANGCNASMSGTVQVIINPLPYQANVTGGGSLCLGGNGLSVGIDTSQVGVDYQLVMGGNNIGAPVAGTGSPMSLGNQTAAGTYTVVATNSTTGCIRNMAGNAVITITNPPTADAGSDATICEGESHTLTGSATNYSTVGWTSSGDGSFDNSGSLTPTYTPGPNDISNGSATLTLTAFGIGSCGNATDQMQLTIIQSPTANAGQDGTTCGSQPYQLAGQATNYSNVIWSTNGDGNFSNNGILNPTYTPGSGDISNGSVILSLTASGISPCGDSTDSMVLTITAGATADAGPDATICADQSHTLSGNANNYTSVLWTGGDGSFDDPNILNPTYTPGPNDISNGSVDLTLTANGPCGNVSDFMTLTIDPLPVANAGPNGVVCEGDDFTLSGTAVNYSSTFWTSAGDGVFNDSTLLNATYTPGPGDISNGSVTLSLTAVGTGQCGDSTDQMNLSIIEAPTANAGPDATICEGQSYTMQASAYPTKTINWTTSGDGNFNNPTLLDPTYTPGPGDITAGSVNLILTVTGSPPCGNAVDSMLLTIEPNPIANAGQDVSVCVGDCATLTASGGITYIWNTQETSASIIVCPTINTTYTVTVTDINGCTDSDEVVVTVNPLPQADAGQDVEICIGDCTNLNASGGILYLWNNSATDATINVCPSNTTVYTVTVTDNNGCTDSDDVTVTVNQLPTANAGQDVSICPGSCAILTATGGVSYLWNNSATNATINVCPTNTTIYTVTVTDINGCTDSDEVTVSLYPLPQANAGPDVSICIGGCTNLNATGGIAYIWNNQETTSTINVCPSITTTYSVTVTDNNGCTDSDEVTVNIILAPTADAGADATVCEGENYTLSGNASNYSAINWTGGDGNFDNAGILNPTYTPGANDISAGSVTLTLNVIGNLPCNPVADSMILTIDPLPIAHAGPDATINMGQTTTLNGAAIGGSGNYSYAWAPADSLVNPNIQNPTTIPLYTTNIFTLTVTDLNTGCQGTDDVTIVVTGMTLTVNATAQPDEICEGNTSQLTAIVSGGSGTYSYSWVSDPPGFTSNIQNPVVSPTITTTYTVTVDDGQDTDDASVTVTVHPNPTADAGQDVTLCEGECSTLNATGGNTYMWNTQETTASINVCPPTTTVYSVTVTDVYGCTDSDHVTVYVNPLPTADAGQDTEICEGGCTDLMASGGVTYLWSNNATDATINICPSITTKYTVTVTDNNGCTDSDDVLITVNPLPQANAGLDISICFGDCTTLVATGGSQYTWNTGETDASIDVCPSSTATYSVTVTDQNGCSDSDDVTVVVNPLPTADAGEDLAVCLGECTTVTATGGISYLWNTQETTATINVCPTITTTYTVIVTDINGCTDSDDVIVVVDPLPTADAGMDLAICEGNCVDLTATGGLNYIWSNNATTSTINVCPTASMTYIVTVSDINGCTDSDDVTVTVNPLPTANAGMDIDMCSGECTDLSASGGVNYLWSNGATDATVNVCPTATMTYIVTTTDINGCTDSDDVTVTVNPLPSADAGIDVTICEGECTNLSATGGITYIWSNQETTSVIAVCPSTTAIYSVVVTDANGCTDSDEVTVTVVSAPVANAGPDASICEGEDYTLSGSATNYNNISWTTAGDGNFNDNTILGPTYTPGSNDISNGSVLLTMNITGNAPCGIDSDDMLLTINPLPIADAGSDITVTNGSSITLNGSATGGSGNYSYSWEPAQMLINPNIQNPTTVNLNNTTIFYLTVTDQNTGCQGSDQVTVTVSGFPLSVDATADPTSICEGEQSQLDVIVTGGTGTNTYSWISDPPGFTSNIANPVVNPTITTTYTVTVNDGLETQSDNVTVTVYANPVANAGQDSEICLGSCVNLGASGGIYYIWNNQQTDANITVCPTITTTYSVTVTDNNGCTDSDDVTVTVNPLPQADAGQDESICLGDCTMLTANGGVLYTWNNNETTAGIDVCPVTTTTYIVTVTDINGCTDSDDVTVTVNPLPQADAGQDVAICSGNCATLNATGGISYAWNNQQTDASIDVCPITTTTYTVTVTDINGCTDSDEVTVTVNSLPQANAGQDMAICYGNCTTLNASGGISYIWNNQQTDASINVCPTITTTYTVTVTDINGCTDSDDVTITVNPLPQADAGSDQSICLGECTMLTASGGIFYNWNNNETTSSIDVCPASTTTYIVTVTDINGCTDSDDIKVTVNPLPQANAGQDMVICLGDCATLIASGGISYAWNNQQTDASIDVCPAVTTAYTVTVTDINGCTDSDDVIVTVNPLPTVDAGQDVSVCLGDCTMLTASGGITYTWNNNETTATINVCPASTTTYIVTVTDINGCTNSDDVIVTVNPLPNADAGQDVAVCSGNCATLNASGGISYIWNNQQTDASINVCPAITTTYTVTVTDINGCTDSDDVTVTVNPLPTADAGQDVEICFGDCTILTAAGGISYLWNNQQTDASIDVCPTITTAYTVTVTDINGCTDSDDVTVNVIPLPLADAGADITVNYGSMTTLNGSGSGGSGNYSYSWSPSNLLQYPNVQNPTTIPLSSTTTFTLTLTDINTNCSGTDDVTVTVTGTALDITVTADPDTICNGSSSQLNANATGGTGNYSYSWISDPAGFSSNLPNPLVNPTITTTYTVTVDDGSFTASASTTITVIDPPTADAGNDVTICEGETIVLNANATNFTSILWTTSGDGNFNDPTILNAEYTPGVNDIATGNVILTFTAFGNAPCGDVNDEMELTIILAPTADAGSNATICEGNSYTLNGSASNFSSLQWVGGDGTFDDATLLGATYYPGQNDIAAGSVTLTLLVSGNYPCSNIYDDMTLTINHPPTADAGSDAIICEDETVMLNGNATNYSAILWSTSGDGNFDDVTLLNAEYTPGANDISNGTVNLVLDVTGNAPCGNATDNMDVTIIAAPTADAGNDATICEGTFINLNGDAANYSNILWTGGDGNFDDPTILNATYTPGTNDINAGNVVLTLTATANSPCNDVSDQMLLTIFSSPTADAGGDASICENDSYTLQANAGNYSAILWTGGDGNFDNPNVLNPTYTPGPFDIANGFVVLTINVSGNAPCGDATDNMTLLIDYLPIITSHPDDTTVDIGASAAFSVSTVGLPAYQWQVSTNGITWNNLVNTPPYSGVNASVLQISSASYSMNGNEYRCLISSGLCEVVSNSATLHVNAPTMITTTAGTVIDCPGNILVPIDVTDFDSVASISLTLDYDPAVLTYQGYQNAHPELSTNVLIVNSIPGRVVVSWYSVIPANIGNGMLLEILFNYAGGNTDLVWDTITTGNCEYSGLSGVVLPSLFINGEVIMAPVISSDPADVTVYNGDNTSFSITADAALGYQWQYSSDGGSSYNNVPNSPPYSGVYSPVLNITNATIAMSGYKYRCQAYSACNAVLSNPATLTVLAKPPIITKAANVSACQGNVILPITVENFDTVSSISLTLEMDAQALSFVGHQNPHPELSSGILLTNSPVPGRVVIGWYSLFDPAIVPNNDTLLELVFNLTGNYSVVSFDTINPGRCEYLNPQGNVMADTYIFGSITALPSPTAFNVIGGGEYCLGSGGSDVGLAGSEIDVEYTLLLNGNSTGIIVQGNGNPITFGQQTGIGNYTVFASHITSNCTGTMNGSVNVSIKPLPVAYNVIGGGSYCIGGAGVQIGVNDSETDVDYELYLNGSYTGITVNGTGSTIYFGNQTAAGNYTVIGTNICGNTSMNGAATVTIDPLPAIFNVTGGGSYCDGGNGVEVGLNGSETLTSYELFRNGNSTGVTLTGTGSALSFGMLLDAGNYTVIATNICGNTNMNSSVDIVINPLPTADAGQDAEICMNDCILLTASGGVTYMWSNNETTANIDVCPSATTTYIVTVTDQNGCTDSDDVTVTVNPLPTADAGMDAAICYGECTDLSASGGANYLWSNGVTDATVNVCPTSTMTYIVTVTDINGCTGSDDVTVTVNPLPTADAGMDVAICYGECTDLMASGGLNYLWSNGSTDATINVCPTSSMTYIVTVTDINGCTGSDDVTVTVNPLPTADAGMDVAICYGECTDLAASGGVNYIWSNGATDATVNVCPTSTMTYIVTVTDINGCTGSDDVTVTVDPLPTADAGMDVAICYGECTDLMASGGVNYLWSNGATDATVNVCPTSTTTYIVTVTDINGCTGSDDVTVTVNPLPTADAGMDVAICYGECTDLMASGGVNYLWSNGATDATLNVCPTSTMTYIVTVTDINGCTGSDDVTVTVNPLPTADAGMDVAICYGVCTDLMASGGVNYLWSNGATDATVNVCPTSTTTYIVTVTDINGCTDSDDVTVTVNPLPTADAGMDVDICYGECTDLMASGGVNYLWSNGATDATVNVCPTSTMTYIVTVTDINGCTGSDDVTVTVNPLPTADAGMDVAICYGECIDLMASGGVNYIWSNGATDATVNVCPTSTMTYIVTVTDINGCTGSDDVTVTVDPLPTADAGMDVAICYGDCTDLMASGGVNYLWSNGATDATVNVCPTSTTTYIVTVTDINGCTDSDDVTVTVNPLPAADAGMDVDICFGECTDLMASGGVNYLWSNGATDATLNVCPTSTMTYIVTVTDINGCTGSDDVTVTVNPLPTADAGMDVAICYGECTDLMASGGVNYLWSNGASDATVNVCPTSTMTYIVTVTDINGCTDSDDVTVTVNPLPTADAGMDVDICYGECTDLMASGGVNYLWSNGATDATVNVCPTSTMTYIVTVTDINGCTDSDDVTVTVNPLPTADAGMDVDICFGDCITLTASGGQTYLWSNSATSAAIDVCPTVTTTYMLTVTDINGCTDSDDVTVTVNPLPTADAGMDVDICFGECTDLMASGGVNYLWSNGATDATVNVCPTSTMTYIVTVADINGCTDSDDVTVTVNPLPTADAGMDVAICFGECTDLMASGGVNYLWSNGATDATVNVCPTSTMTYIVTVTDINGCTDSDDVTVTVNPLPTADAGMDMAICYADCTTLTASGGQTYLWSNSATSAAIDVCPTVTTTYMLTVTDINGCTDSDDVTVTVNPLPLADAGPDATICNNDCIDITASGGNDYLWNNGETNATINVCPNITTTYMVTVTDINGCTDSDDVTITVNPLPTADAGVDVAVCYGECVDLTASGGVSYNWNNNETTSTINVCPTSTTTYIVTVTDINGCTDSDDVTVTVNPLPTADAGMDVAICHGDCTTLTASGGQTYLWSNSATSAIIDVCPTVTTTYMLTVTDINGCTDSDDVTVTVNPLPLADAGQDATICNNDCIDIIATGGNDYTWNNGETNATINVCPNITTTYVVTVTDMNGCTDSDDVTITVNPLPTAEAGMDMAICYGECVDLTASGGVSYNWNNNETTSTINVCPTSTTTYIVTVTDINGCTDSDDVTVTVNPLPTADAGMDVSICEGDCTVLSASGGITYIWSNNVTTATNTVCPTISTTYSVTITDVNGCTASDDVTVFIYAVPSVFNVIGGGAYCAGGNGVMISLDGSTVGIDYELYYNGTATGNIVAGTGSAINFGYQTAVGDYTVTAIYACGTVDMAGIASVSVLPVPNADAGVYSVICKGTSTILNGSASGGTPPYNFSWTPAGSLDNPNISNPLASPQNSTTYTLHVTDANGCMATDNVIVIVKPVPDVDAGIDITIFNGASTTLNGSVTGGLPPYTIDWTPTASLSDPSILNPIAAPTVTTTYTLTVTGANGCSSSDEVTITVTNQPGIYNILGHIAYDNAQLTSLNNTTVDLSEAGSGTLINSTISNTYGNYLFTGLSDNTYITNGNSTKPWAGVNSIDALLIMQHFVHLDTLKGIRLGAADVDNTGGVNSTDALMVMQRFVSMINTFPSGDWLFETKNVTISGSDVINNFLGLCYGDVNGSNIPGAKISPTIKLFTEGTMEVQSFEEFVLPISVKTALDVSAISLVIDYPSDLIEVVDVIIDNKNKKSTEHENLLFNTSDNKLKIAWYSLSGLNLKDSEALLKLKLRTVRKTIDGENIYISISGESQLGDNSAKVIDNVELDIPKIIVRDNQTTYELKPNYPNPFSDITSIEYQIPEKGTVNLSIYNTLGEKVAVLVNKDQDAGLYLVKFDRTDLKPGVYLYRLNVRGINSDYQNTKTMIISN